MLVLESFVVLTVNVFHLKGDLDLLLCEVVDKVCDERSHLFLLVEHRHDEVDEFAGILGHRLRILVDNGVEEFSDRALIERWLETCH